MDEVDADIHVKSICINVISRKNHIEPLKEIGVSFINIKSPADFSWIINLKKCINDYNADIIFAHGFNGAILSLIERWFCGIQIPIILTYHGEYHAPTRSKKYLEPLYNGLSHYIYKRIAKKIICVAKYSRKYLIEKGVRKKNDYCT